MLTNTPLLHSQQTSSLQRNAAATAMLQKCLAAMQAPGSNMAPGSIQTATVAGTIQKTKGKDSVQGTFRFLDSFATGKHEYRRDVTLNGSTHRLISHGGKPEMADGGAAVKPLPIELHRYYDADHIPYKLIDEAVNDSSIGILLVRQSIVDRRTIAQIETVQMDGTTPLKRAWYIDVTTSLPIALAVMLPTASNNGSMEVAQITKYRNYTAFGTVINPADISVSLNGRRVLDLHVTLFAINGTIPTSQFESLEN